MRTAWLLHGLICAWAGLRKAWHMARHTVRKGCDSSMRTSHKATDSHPLRFGCMSSDIAHAAYLPSISTIVHTALQALSSEAAHTAMPRSCLVLQPLF
ncbi:hypothetical protein Q3G72_008452 [Acer saccharum]|nr:hypothetical protein Q3G72_008452 [Acer saccharum]